ncbi:hypothetical protein ABVT39_003966 [Epinephelus coioides]
MMVKKAMPESVQRRLEDVVGLMKMDWPLFSEHIVHHVELYRKDRKKKDEEDKQLASKLTQLQLGELSKLVKKEKEKSKIQAPVVAATPAAPPTIQPQVPLQPPPTDPNATGKETSTSATHHHYYYQQIPREGTPHDCIHDTEKFMRAREDLHNQPIPADLTLFVDGSCFRYATGSHAGYGIIQLNNGDQTFDTLQAPRGNKIEHWLSNTTHTNTSQEAERLIQCRYEKITGNVSSSAGTLQLSEAQKVCNTTREAKIQCPQVVNGGEDSIVLGQNYNDTTWIWVLNLIDGTIPLADIFWICESDLQVKAVLPANWTGLCAPAMLTGPITILSLTNSTPVRRRRSSESQGRSWEEDASVYITWDQIPQGVPRDQQAIADEWVETGRVLGSWPIWGTVVNAQYIARNSRWVNYLWYNQQRFVNWTMRALEEVNEKLHATSLMTVQNRLVIETLLAHDQGVCDIIGEHCCTVIPMHTGEGGNLTKALEGMHTLRDQHVQHSNWNTRIPSMWDWLSALSPEKILKMMGMLLGIVVLALLTIACCVLPLVRLVIKRTMTSVTGQFVVIDQGPRPTSAESYEDMTGSQRQLIKKQEQGSGGKCRNQNEIMPQNRALGTAQYGQRSKSAEEVYDEIA